MGKGLNRQKKGLKNSKFNGRPRLQQRSVSFGEENMDDEIDAFHKQRDVIPIDVNHDAGDASDEEGEQPVFDFEDDDHDTDDTDSGSNGDENDNTGHSKDYVRMLRQKKILQKKYGVVKDDVDDDTEQEEEQKAFFGRGKQFLYGADNIDFETQSDEEDLAEEEAMAVLSQKEKAKSLSMEDFGLEDIDKEESEDDNQEKTLQDISGKESHVFGTLEDDAFESYEEIKKDLNALSLEEQMDIVHSSAPELVGLLSELNEAVNHLYRVKPLLFKAKETKGALDYLETKHKLLLAYLQAITFYLLLKSEGHPVHDHPVIARLVEIKNLWEKVKSMDSNISSLVEEIVDHNGRNNAGKIVQENVVPEFELAVISIPDKAIEAPKVSEFINSGMSKEDNSSKHINQKPQNGQVGQQSLEMFKVRAALEEKLKKKGFLNSIAPKTGKVHNHASKTLHRHLEALTDFDDDATDAGMHRGVNGELHKFVPMKVNKPMFVSGDDDLPMRDDLGEKRIKYVHKMVDKAEKQRKRELRALAKTGTGSNKGIQDDVVAAGARSTDGDVQVDSGMESEDEFYKEVKRQRLTKLSAKATLYSRAPSLPSSLEIEADGKRHITYQMEKNRGLTRNRKKLTKIPRKKYKVKHQKAVVRRKGQVRDIRKPAGPYGGEASGINTRVSRSIRFKN